MLMKEFDTIDPLDEEFLEKRKAAAIHLGVYNGVLEDRITYIVHEICRGFDLKYLTWYFPNAAEGEVGNFDGAEHHDSFQIHMEYTEDGRKRSYGNDLVILLKDGSEWELYEIPKHWLIEDFEEELEQGKVAYLTKLENKKKKAKEKLSKKKEEEKALLEQIKKKLTPSELRLLKKVK